MPFEAFNSLKDTITTRFTNPFLGTFLIVWCFRNWVVVYTLFTLDMELPLHDRVDAIEKYFTLCSFYWEAFISALVTLVVLIFTYAAINVSHGVVTFSKLRIKPEIDRRIDTSSIVPRDRYQEAMDDIRVLQTRLDEERALRISIQKDLDESSEDNSNSYRRQTAQGREETFERIYRALVNQELLEYFVSIASEALLTGSISGEPDIVNRIIPFGLIQRKGGNPIDGYEYSLTNQGQELLQYITVNHIK